MNTEIETLAQPNNPLNCLFLVSAKRSFTLANWLWVVYVSPMQGHRKKLRFVKSKECTKVQSETKAIG